MLIVFWYFVCYVVFFIIGLNCVFGVDVMCEYFVEIFGVVDIFVCVYLNVGLFNEFGEYDESFEVMVVQIEGFVKDGLVNIVGGCCGLMFDYICVVVQVVVFYLFCVIFEQLLLMCLFGLEFFILIKDILFVNVGEWINVIGSVKFCKLIINGDYVIVLDVVC